MAKRDLSSGLSWDYNLYTPAELEKLSEKEVRAEYTKLRDILQKRYKRMLADPEYKHTPWAQEYKEHGIKKLRDIPARGEINWRLTRMAWDIVEGDSSIQRLEEERKARDQVVNEFTGSEDVKTVSDEERGRFWQWIKGKYTNAYLPPSDITNDQVTELLSGDKGRVSRRIIFGQWRANEARESEYQYVRISNT